jgi:hypothetical protein
MSKSFTSTISKSSSTKSNNKYVPPSQRYNSGSSSFTLNKRQTKAEEFNLNEKIGVFPTLGETIKLSATSTVGITNKMNFASVAKYVEKTSKEEEKVVEVQPGWVHIRKHNGKIEYKYGAQKHDPSLEWYFVQEDAFIDKNFVKSIIARLQYAQDYENVTLGDLSAYYDFPNIQEKLEADAPKGYHHRRPKRPTNINNNSDSELSYVSDDTKN